MNVMKFETGMAPTTVVDNKFFLQPDDHQNIRLSKKHDYYLQVQDQLAICNKKYTDFMCWTPHGMHVARIIRNVAAFNAILPSLDGFFKDVVLPRLLRGPSSDKTKTPHSRISNVTSTTGSKAYCWCQQEGHGGANKRDMEE